MAKIPDKYGGWSVVYREVADDDSSPFQQMGQGLYKGEAITLGKILFERDRLGHVEILDTTATTRGYFSPKKPNGAFE
jgi:hypothetical protein